jgi:aromatic ring-opening dioxygenase catalytic subunit (LigB family)
VLSSANPPLLYDYYGFPPETYELKWPAPGDPALASRVRELLEAGGFSTAEDSTRGWDHGVFIPMKLSFPDADVPTVQLSLIAGLDPEKHLAMGRALAPLRKENVLIVGSGQSFHNMSGFFGGGFEEPSREFDVWLNETCAGVEPKARSERLRNWTAAPSARAIHPREEHLAPLFVTVGAAEDDPGERIFSDVVLNLAMSGYAFG